MFRFTAFYIGEKTLDLNSHEFPLGGLTAEVLNITPDEHHELRRKLDKTVRKMLDGDGYHEIQAARPPSRRSCRKRPEHVWFVWGT